MQSKKVLAGQWSYAYKSMYTPLTIGMKPKTFAIVLHRSEVEENKQKKEGEREKH